MTIKIKKEKLGDIVPTLFEIDNKAFNRDFDLPSKDIAEQKRYLKNSVVYVAYDEETPVGFFAYESKNNKEIEVKSIAVIPEYQRKGVGKLMLRELQNLTKDHNLQTVTHPYNSGAIILYLKHGFQVYGWNDNYYGDGQPRLLLKLSKDK